MKSFFKSFFHRPELFWAMMTLTPSLSAQETVEIKHDTLHLKIEKYATLTIRPALLDTEPFRFIPDARHPVLKDEPAQTVFDEEKGFFVFSNLSGELWIDTSRLRSLDILVTEASVVKGSLPYAPVSNILIKGNSSVTLHYSSPLLSVSAAQSSMFVGYGSGPCTAQYFRAGSGSYISDSHTDTVRSQRCSATGMSIIDTRRTPVREAFDTVNQSTVSINAQRVYWNVSENSQACNIRNRKADSTFLSQNNEKKGQKIPIKEVFRDDSADERIEKYYSDLLEDKRKGNNLYLEDFVFAGKKNRTAARFRGQWMGLEAKLPLWIIPDRKANDNWDLNYIETSSIAWNVFQFSFGFNSSHWGFVTGAGFLWENYIFNYPNTVISKENHQLTLSLDNSPERKYKKSKLGLSYFRIPLLFEYTNAKGAWKSVHVSAGAIPGVLMCSWSKQVFRENGKRQVEKNKTDFYVNPFRLDLALYAGWGPFSLFVTYSPFHLFQNGKAPDILPVGVGILIGIH